MLPNIPEIQNECVIRGVSHQVIADVQAGQILQEISDPEVNMERITLSCCKAAARSSRDDAIGSPLLPERAAFGLKS